jgi:hypothetical protein
MDEEFWAALEPVSRDLHATCAVPAEILTSSGPGDWNPAWEPAFAMILAPDGQGRASG